MCLTFFIIKPSQIQKQIEFIIAFNRDQQTKRETLPFDKFSDDPNIYAGRDMISSGTWLGFNIKTGLFVFLTNYDLIVPRSGLSRGKLIKKLLSTEFAQAISNPQQLDRLVQSELQQVLNQRQKYTACNIVVYNALSTNAFYVCTELEQNKMEKPWILQKKYPYGLCNTDIHTTWAKTGYGLEKFKKIVQITNKDFKQQEETQNHQFINILMNQLQGLMKDKKWFTQSDQDQSSIFVEPYYSKAEKAERMTKSTFVAIFTKKQGSNTIQMHYKQISYENDLSEKIRKGELKTKIKSQQIIKSD